jgi:beta-lactamase regulating signal transducer with metallopeptidase domain
MIAAWMVYCALCALGFALAAVLAERLLAGRGPVRHVWVVAVLLSVVVPAMAFRFSAPAATPASAVPVVDGGQLPAADVLDSVAGSPATVGARVTTTARRWSWRASIDAADTPLAIVWLTFSSALIAHFLCGMIALSWMRRWWRRDTVQGVDVLVSQTTGPALVGALSPAIVVPEWALSMDAAQIDLMLRHEQEHRRARDGQLLTLAHLALVVMPWNVALWWLLMRLRVAIELDCDARVLRDADARSYGDLLLEVARPRRRLMLMGATAFAERASQLERRIRAIGGGGGGGRRRVRASRLTRIAVAGIAVVVVTAAWVAPRPPVPARASSPVNTPAPVITAPRADSTAHTRGTADVQASPKPGTPKPAVVAHDSALAKPSRSTPVNDDSTPHQIVAAPAVRDSAPAPTSPTLARRDVPGNVVLRQSAPLDVAPQRSDSIFEYLFAGITLSPSQEAAARDLVRQLEMAQVTQMTNTLKALVAAQPLRQAIQAQADSGLEALLTDDADRATLHSRFAPQVPGGRGGGRSASLVGDTTFVLGGGRGARVGGGGFAPAAGVGGGGGRGGARGGGGALSPAAAANAVDLVFHRLFDGIALAPQQESDARAIIGKMQADMRATNPPVPATIIARRPFSNMVTMGPESAAAFGSLLSNDADRATLQSHIVIEVRVIETPPR